VLPIRKLSVPRATVATIDTRCRKVHVDTPVEIATLVSSVMPCGVISDKPSVRHHTTGEYGWCLRVQTVRQCSRRAKPVACAWRTSCNATTSGAYPLITLATTSRFGRPAP